MFDFGYKCNALQRIISTSDFEIGDLKTCNISYNYQSTLMETPATLPTAEPATPQISYTFDAGMFPTLSGDLPESIDYVGFLLAGCANSNASTDRTLNWRVKLNGVSIGNGTQSVTASNKATLNFLSLVGENKPVVGAIAEIFLWCTESDTDMQVNRHAIGIIPTRFKPVNNSNLLILSSGLVSANTDVPANFTRNVTYAATLKKVYLTNLTSFNAGTLLEKGLFEEYTYGVWSNQLDTVVNNTVRVHATEYRAESPTQVTQSTWKPTNLAVA